MPMKSQMQKKNKNKSKHKSYLSRQQKFTTFMGINLPKKIEEFFFDSTGFGSYIHVLAVSTYQVSKANQHYFQYQRKFKKKFADSIHQNSINGQNVANGSFQKVSKSG